MSLAGIASVSVVGVVRAGDVSGMGAGCVSTCPGGLYRKQEVATEYRSSLRVVRARWLASEVVDCHWHPCHLCYRSS
jgi:hypothetical protein